MSDPFDKDTQKTGSEIIERLEEHRELLKKLAESDLPVSEDAKRALALLNEEDQS